MIATFVRWRFIVASITIRKLSNDDKQRLRVRAAHNGRSMEAEARAILHETLCAEGAEEPGNLADRIRALFEPIGGVDLPEIPREPAREPPKFE
jgi:plasmid stability protein